MILRGLQVVEPIRICKIQFNGNIYYVQFSVNYLFIKFLNWQKSANKIFHILNNLAGTEYSSNWNKHKTYKKLPLTEIEPDKP